MICIRRFAIRFSPKWISISNTRITVNRCVRNLTLRWRHNGCDSLSNHQPHHCLLNRLFRRRSKKTSKLRVTGLFAGNSPGTGEFSAQMASNAENVSIWWRHHGKCLSSWSWCDPDWSSETHWNEIYHSTICQYMFQLPYNSIFVAKSHHDDVIKWKHFPRYWPFVRGIHRSLVNSPHKGQWRGALNFSLICVRINGRVNNREAGDLRRHQVHCDVIVMIISPKPNSASRDPYIPP